MRKVNSIYEHFTEHIHADSIDTQYCILYLQRRKCFCGTHFPWANTFHFPGFLLRCWINKEHFISLLPHVALSINRTANTTTTTTAANNHFINSKFHCVHTAQTVCAHCVPIVIYFHCGAYCTLLIYALHIYALFLLSHKLPAIFFS